MFKHGVDDKDVMVGYLQSKLREASVLWAVVVMVRWKDQLQKLRRQRQHQSDQRTVCQHCSVLHQHTLQSSLAGLAHCMQRTAVLPGPPLDPWVGSTFFSFWWVGSTIVKVLKIWKNYVNAFKARLDKIWLHQAVKFDFTADLTGIPETDHKE